VIYFLWYRRSSMQALISSNHSKKVVADKNESMNADVRWQQRFANYRRALEQLESFFEPPELNAREQQAGLDQSI